MGHAIEKSRIEGTTADVLRQWFHACQLEIFDDPNGRIENVYNFDEAGFSIGTIKAGRVVIDRRVKNNYRTIVRSQLAKNGFQSLNASVPTVPLFRPISFSRVRTSIRSGFLQIYLLIGLLHHQRMVGLAILMHAIGFIPSLNLKLMTKLTVFLVFLFVMVMEAI